jgi:ribose 5-phosphate isomerase B
MSPATAGNTPLDVRAIAHRAAQRALAERGSAPGSQAQLLGVHVAVTAPDAQLAAKKPSRGRDLVDATSLRSTADGAQFLVPRGAIVTDLAREEAKRRRINLVDVIGTTSAARGTRRVALGADHGGFALKREILSWLTQFEAVGVDLGTRDENPCDYPDFARAVALAVASGEVDFGILVDGAGIGSAIAANKVPGIRAANCGDVAMARNAREHNFANVLTLAASLPRNVAYQIIHTFLSTATGAERHAKRVQKISAIEQHYTQVRKP